MDWRFNTIWFERIEQDKFFKKDVKDNIIMSEHKNFENSEYAILWHLKEKDTAFNNLPKNDNLSYLELNWANIKNLGGIEKFKNLKRLELHYCVKLESDFGLNRLSDSLQHLHINTCKKFEFTDELLQLKNLRVLCLNSTAPVENLDFLKYFPNLIDFRFVNTNVLDGNLQPILDHPTIRTVGFLNKKHYNYKDDKIDSELQNKSQEEYRTAAYNGVYFTERYDYE